MPRTFVDTLAGQTMNLGLSKTLGGTRNLAGLCTDLFLIIIRMREADEPGRSGLDDQADQLLSGSL